MPAALAFIPLIATVAAAGTSVFELAKGGGPSASDLQKQQQQRAQADAAKVAQQEAQQRDQLFRREAPNAQEQTGGSLTDQPLASLIATLAGQPGSVQDAFRITNPGQSFGGTSPSSTPFNLSSFFDNPDLHGLSSSLSGGEVSPA